MTLFVTEIFS